MFQNIELFQSASAMARHAGQQQSVVARNMANADTPGYRAQGVTKFADTYTGTQTGQMRNTRAGHMSAAMSGKPLAGPTSRAEPSPNGNSVSLEQEMLNAVQVQREHGRALAIYKHGLDILRISIGRK